MFNYTYIHPPLRSPPTAARFLDPRPPPPGHTHTRSSPAPIPNLKENPLGGFTRMQPVQILRRYLLQLPALLIADFVVESHQKGRHDNTLFEFGKLVREHKSF